MSSPVPPDGPTRRAVLVGVVAGLPLVLAGCRHEAPAQHPGDDERLLRDRIATDVTRLSSAYTAVVARYPESAPRLEPLAGELALHVQALRGSPTPPAARRDTPSTTPGVPSTWPQARDWLAGQERAAATRRGAQARTAAPELARLLASISACNVVHATLLEALP